MTTRRSARALGTSMMWGIGAGELARRLTLEEATAEAERMARRHRIASYVYRLNGCLTASTNEPAIMLGAELVAEVEAMHRDPHKD
jgi:hypothetical protein